MTMRTSRTTLAVLLSFMGSVPTLRAQQPPPEALAPALAQAPPQQAGGVVERTPPRLSFTQGEVSFWRPGAEDWTPAQLNTPLAPGDALYSATVANLELQVGAHAFVRVGERTQLGLENQEPDFMQFNVTTGHAAFDLRRLQPGHTVEVDTPKAAFTIETAGYYRVDISADRTAFFTRRGGSATMTSADGETSAIASSEVVVIQGAEKPSVETYVAPELDAWDRWNYARTDHLMEVVSERYVSRDVYGTDELDHHGTWRIVPEYGPVWIPQGLPPDWAPYCLGNWIWDPDYEWTWVDQAPWGWAPYHYGRWVFIDGLWAWAPGPLLVPPVYAPALVAFFGGSDFGIGIGIGAPAVGWVALDWGEPLIPWWGPVDFIGVPWWGGWGGPRVGEHPHAPRHLPVRHAVTAVRDDRFGRGRGEFIRVHDIDPHRLEFIHGKVPVQPVAASLSPGGGHAARPPEAALQRTVVGTRTPHDYTASLRSAGLAAPPEHGPEPRIVTVPSAPHVPFVAPRPPFGQQGTTERKPPPVPPRYGESRPSPSEPRSPGNLPGQPANRLYRGGPGAVPRAGSVRSSGGRR